jgi:hypothetical protein
MYIFVDPLRKPQVAKFDETIRSFKAFIEIVDKHDITFMSLDYNVDSKSNAIDILWYLKENNIKIPFINIHTRNNIARSNIRKMIKKYFPDTIITFIKEI